MEISFNICWKIDFISWMRLACIMRADECYGVIQSRTVKYLHPRNNSVLVFVLEIRVSRLCYEVDGWHQLACRKLLWHIAGVCCKLTTTADQLPDVARVVSPMLTSCMGGETTVGKQYKLYWYLWYSPDLSCRTGLPGSHSFWSLWRVVFYCG